MALTELVKIDGILSCLKLDHNFANWDESIPMRSIDKVLRSPQPRELRTPSELMAGASLEPDYSWSRAMTRIDSDYMSYPLRCCFLTFYLKESREDNFPFGRGEH